MDQSINKAGECTVRRRRSRHSGEDFARVTARGAIDTFRTTQKWQEAASSLGRPSSTAGPQSPRSIRPFVPRGSRLPARPLQKGLPVPTDGARKKAEPQKAALLRRERKRKRRTTPCGREEGRKAGRKERRKSRERGAAGANGSRGSKASLGPLRLLARSGGPVRLPRWWLLLLPPPPGVPPHARQSRVKVRRSEALRRGEGGDREAPACLREAEEGDPSERERAAGGQATNLRSVPMPPPDPALESNEKGENWYRAACRGERKPGRGGGQGRGRAGGCLLIWKDLERPLGW